jgi:hypothetical protein
VVKKRLISSYSTAVSLLSGPFSSVQNKRKKNKKILFLKNRLVPRKLKICFKIIARAKKACAPPPPGSKFLLWPGGPRGIDLSAVASPGGLDFRLWPPQESNFLLWPSLGIGPSALALHGGSDFLLWPLPGERTIRYSPPQGIGLSTVAPSGG